MTDCSASSDEHTVTLTVTRSQVHLMLFCITRDICYLMKKSARGVSVHPQVVPDHEEIVRVLKEALQTGTSTQNVCDK
jgi:hypothetical protein